MQSLLKKSKEPDTQGGRVIPEGVVNAIKNMLTTIHQIRKKETNIDNIENHIRKVLATVASVISDEKTNVTLCIEYRDRAEQDDHQPAKSVKNIYSVCSHNVDRDAVDAISPDGLVSKMLYGLYEYGSKNLQTFLAAARDSQGEFISFESSYSETRPDLDKASAPATVQISEAIKTDILESEILSSKSQMILCLRLADVFYNSEANEEPVYQKGHAVFVEPQGFQLREKKTAKPAERKETVANDTLGIAVGQQADTSSNPTSPGTPPPAGNQSAANPYGKLFYRYPLTLGVFAGWSRFHFFGWLRAATDFVIVLLFHLILIALFFAAPVFIIVGASGNGWDAIRVAEFSFVAFLPFLIIFGTFTLYMSSLQPYILGRDVQDDDLETGSKLMMLTKKLFISSLISYLFTKVIEILFDEKVPAVAAGKTKLPKPPELVSAEGFTPLTKLYIAGACIVLLGCYYVYLNSHKPHKPAQNKIG